MQVQLSKGRALAGVKLVHGIFSDADPQFSRLGAQAARAAKSLAQALRFKGEAERSAEIPLGAGGRTLTLVGLGNTSACEALSLAGLSPRRSPPTVQGERAERLVAAIKKVLQRSIEDGGSTLRDHVQPGGELGYFQTRFNVYDRAGIACPTRGCGRSPPIGTPSR